ncbi:MAG: glycosyltransferase family 4 protein [Ardenticatenaceae bacterium]|nr:glycosyltransferase family 4 protein [Ardenticatenaceae bacterium]
MHLGLVIYGSLDTVSGGYLYDRQLVNFLRTAGHEVEIISIPWRNYPRHLSDNFSRDFLEALAAKPFDLLLQDELNHPSLFWLNTQLKKRVSYPIVAIVHHLRSSEFHPGGVKWAYRMIEKRYLNTVDGFIYNSKTTRDAVESVIGQRTPHLVAFPAGNRFDPVRCALQSLRHSNLKKLNIVFVGNLIPRKGLHTLLQAAAHLPFQAWQVDVVGDLNVDPFYALDMMKFVEDKHLEEHIHFWGRLDDEALAHRLTMNDVLVVPSQYEGFGIVYLEAMGFGLAAIGTTGGAAGEIIENGRTGFLIRPGDIVALARHLTELHKNRPLLSQMSAAAMERFANHPTWEDSCAQIERFLRKLVY